MTETIKAEIDEALAKKFRKKAMEKYGYKKGAVKLALQDAIKKFVGPAEVDWHELEGALKLDKVTSVELQHSMWRKRVDPDRH